MMMTAARCAAAAAAAAALATLLAIALVSGAATSSTAPLFAPVTSYRVAPALGARCGDYVRITATTPKGENHSARFNSFFSYNAPFRYRWTDKVAHTTLYKIRAGSGPQTINIGEAGELQMTVSLPTIGGGVRGIIIADPCIVSEFAHCETAAKEHVGIRLPLLLNAAMSDPTISFLTIAGDVFYDGDGTITPRIMKGLSPALKDKLLLTTAGNYDLWQSGTPKQRSPGDQLGNGYMQTFGQDTLASLSDPNTAPFNFSVDPDKVDPSAPHAHFFPAPSNFQTFTIVGNIGFILFNNAVHAHLNFAFYGEACRFFKNNEHVVDKIFVVGHWLRDDKGCASNKTTTPSVYAHILEKHSHQGCPHHKMKYFVGHHHCNQVVEAKKGFLVAGQGKDDNSCRNFGLPYVDSTGGRLLVAYFPILHNDEVTSIEAFAAQRRQLVAAGRPLGALEKRYASVLRSPKKRFEALMACASQSGGLSECASQASVEVEIWLDESISR